MADYSAADLGSMIENGADLAPLMGTFSFSGRDPNLEESDEEEEEKIDSQIPTASLEASELTSRRTEIGRSTQQ